MTKNCGSSTSTWITRAPWQCFWPHKANCQRLVVFEPSHTGGLGVPVEHIGLGQNPWNPSVNIKNGWSSRFIPVHPPISPYKFYLLMHGRITPMLYLDDSPPGALGAIHESMPNIFVNKGYRMLRKTS